MPTIKDQAVCIRHWDWSETSQTISLFSRDHGVIRVVAKGAKRDKAPFSGGVELLTLGEMVAIVRHNERSADALSTLVSWDLTEPFAALRRSLSAFYTGLYLADLVHCLVRDSDPHAVLFDRFAFALGDLGDEPAGNQAVLLCFQWAALVQAGFAPELNRDAITGAPLTDQQTLGFSPNLGGLTAAGGAGSARAIEPVWRVRAETVQVLRRAAADEGSFLRVAPVLAAESVLRANRLLAWYFRFILGAWPKSASAALPGVTEVAP